MTDVAGLVLSVVDISVRLGKWLWETFKSIAHNPRAIERLLQRYNVVGDELRQLSQHPVAWSSFLQENITQLHEYFCDAKHTLERMKNTTVARHRSLRAVWKANRFADEVLKLATGLDVAENKLLHLSTHSGQSSRIANVQCDVQSLKAFSEHMILELREQIMVEFRECIREELPKSLADVKKLESKAVERAVLSRPIQPLNCNEGVNGVYDDVDMERRIALCDQRMAEIRQIQCDPVIEDPVSLEVRKVTQELWQPWHLNPTSDVRISDVVESFGMKTMKIIGTGSTSVVYEGSVKKFNDTERTFRAAAVKVPKKALRISTWKSDFLREVELMSDLHHPCIVEFLGAYWPDFSEKSHDPFIALELMTHNIMQLGSNVLTTERTMKILLDVAEGLEYLHDLGVVHMDVKPENILVRIDENGSVIGRVKLSDFGVSRKKWLRSVYPTAGGGTLAYMAPELRQDSRGKARPSCDVWSFGTTMLQLLRTQRFLSGDSGISEQELSDELQKMILDESADGLARVIENERLRLLTLKCLQSNPELRPNMSDVRRELLCIDIGVRPYIARTFIGKTADVLFSEGIRKFFGLGTARNPSIAWEMLSIASRLDHADSAVALDHCFSCDREERKAEAIFRMLESDDSNPVLLILLGICAALSFGTRRSETHAFILFEKAADAGHATAQCYLGVCYECGTGVEKNMVRAVSLYQQAADSGNARAQCNLGVCYEYGTGIERNMARAMSLYQQAADSGHATAQCNLGVCHEHGTGVEKNIERAVSLYQQAADAGDATAQFNLGVCYEHGTGVEKNMVRAVSLYQQAADAGDATAQCNLGVCHEHGTGVEKNIERAVSLYQQAADAGDATAQFNLGVCYEHGTGVEKNVAKAVSLYRQAADSGNATAQFNLGVCYKNGRGVEKNTARAVSLYQQAADAGDATAQCNLGVCYECGTGVEKNMVRAVSLYQQAADSGNARAQCNLGVCYEYGTGVEKNMVRAVSLYQQAADSGNATAQCNLGLCYTYGTGVEKNMVRAVSLYQQAADAGIARARSFLVDRENNSSGSLKSLVRSLKRI